MIRLWVLCGVLTFTVILLLIKLYLMKKSADEIRAAFTDRLTTDTNTLIDTSSQDRHMRRLADAINIQLRQLRAQRQRFMHGDTELKEAVTNISHDLRTPLTAISGYLQLMEREEKSVTVTRYLDMIGNRTQALKSLTEELLRYSIITSEQTLAVSTVLVGDVLEESIAAAYGALTLRGITPEIAIPDEKVERFLDRSALSRIFENIIANAIKYSDGDLNIKMSREGTIEFSNAAADIDPVSVGRLFERFYTVETGRSSTGLGLSIAKLLTERMGGSITADYRDKRLYIEVCFPSDTRSWNINTDS